MKILKATTEDKRELYFMTTAPTIGKISDHKGEQIGVSGYAFYIDEQVDKETGESYTVDETVDFNADVLGSVSAPYPIYIVTPTGINGITADAPSVKGIYNMMGQKVKSASRGGVYVINGRKSVVTKRNEHEYMK